jgi:hypothetical protein
MEETFCAVERAPGQERQHTKASCFNSTAFQFWVRLHSNMALMGFANPPRAFLPASSRRYIRMSWRARAGRRRRDSCRRRWKRRRCRWRTSRGSPSVDIQGRVQLAIPSFFGKGRKGPSDGYRVFWLGSHFLTGGWVNKPLTAVRAADAADQSRLIGYEEERRLGLLAKCGFAYCPVR